jgi:hypothetical protein
MNLPPGGGTLYAAQVVCVGFHSYQDDGAQTLYTKGTVRFEMIFEHWKTPRP